METDILQTLQVATGQAVAASAMPTLPIKFLGRTFVIPSDQKWLELVHLPNNIPSQFWGNEKTFRGTLRLILHCPNNDQGSYEPISLLEQVGSFFTKAKLLQIGVNSMQFYDNPDYSGDISTGTDTIFVVSVRYQCFAAE